MWQWVRRKPRNEAVLTESTDVLKENHSDGLEKESSNSTNLETTTSVDSSIESNANDRESLSVVDLSGNWTLVVTDDFLQEYDAYLQGLGQPLLVRKVALGLVDRTTEETRQVSSDELFVCGRNVRGTWERTLTTQTSTIRTADGEAVQAQAWWENNVHVSWLRGVTKYGGGDFESRRYMDKDGQLVCESIFHGKQRGPAKVTWRFARQET